MLINIFMLMYFNNYLRMKSIFQDDDEMMTGVGETRGEKQTPRHSECAMVAFLPRTALSLFNNLRQHQLLPTCHSVWSTRISTAVFKTFCLSFPVAVKSMADERIGRLETNAEAAESLIADIYSKLKDIEKASRGEVVHPDLTRLREENEALRLEVAKWKELLIIREIKNGGNPIIRDPVNVGKSAKVKVEKVETPPSTETSQPAAKAQGKKVAIKEPSKESVCSNESESAKPAEGSKNKGQPKAKDSSNAGGAAPPGGSEDIDVSKLDMRIGLIVECERHPDADALYVEKIDLGEGKPRTIISGLVKHVPIEEMRNRMVVILANLKPAKMRGIFSEGMVMCASTPEKVEILLPPPGSVPGDLVEVEGYPRNPETVMNPKKKIFETVQPDLKTNEKKEATYKGALWVVPGKGVVTTATMPSVGIK